MAINIITYTDCSYLKHATVMLASLITMASAKNDYCVFLRHSCKDEEILNTKPVSNLKDL